MYLSRMMVVVTLSLGALLVSVPAAALPQDGADTVAPQVVDTSITGKAIRCQQGKILEFDCQNVELLSYLPNNVLDGAAGWDMWGWTDSATGREFLILAGGGDQTAVVEVTDPIHPKHLGFLRPGGTSVKVYKQYAFLTSEDPARRPGIRVFDLTQLRAPQTTPVDFAPTARNDSLVLALHTMALNPATGFVYGNGGDGPCGGGLHMIDVRTPMQPTVAGCYIEKQIGDTPGWIHDSQCLLYHGPDRDYQGREICIAAGVKAVAIADVTDKQHPKTISLIRYPDIAYAHQGWLSEDQRYFYLDDEFDESKDFQKYQTWDSVYSRTRIFDLQDLDDPVVLPDFVNRASHAVDHNLYIRGRYMYQGNYGAGLRIIDIADPVHPKEVGYLTQIKNAWGTYPFLKNDVVAVSADRGLFLVRLQSR